MPKELKLKEKSIYGNVLIYPNCEDSITFAALLGKKTLCYTDIHYIEQLGYKVNVQRL